MNEFVDDIQEALEHLWADADRDDQVQPSETPVPPHPVDKRRDPDLGTTWEPGKPPEEPLDKRPARPHPEETATEEYFWLRIEG